VVSSRRGTAALRQWRWRVFDAEVVRGETAVRSGRYLEYEPRVQAALVAILWSKSLRGGTDRPED
jgi:hypothetical protein